MHYDPAPYDHQTLAIVRCNCQRLFYPLNHVCKFPLGLWPRFIHTLVVAFWAWSGTAQSLPTYSPDSIRYSVETHYHHGIVIPHHTSMAYFINDYSRGAELSLTRCNFNAGSWYKYFNYPETGITLFYQTFGNPSIYGQGMALYPFVRFRMFGKSWFSTSYQLGLGLAYATKTFDVNNNPYNSLLGSHLNAFVRLGLSFNAQITPRIGTYMSGSLNHLSNGAIQKPNNGINTATLSVGATYILTPINRPSVAKTKPPTQHNHHLLTTASIGSNQTTEFGSDRHLSGSISVTHIWSHKPTSGFGIGIDATYYGGAPSSDPNADLSSLKSNYAFKDYLYSSLFGAYHLQMDKTTVFVNIGAYLYQGTPARQPVYPRIGIRHELSQGLLAHFGVKASFFRAEYLEFGLAYKLKYKKGKK